MPPKRRRGNGRRVAYRFVTRALPELRPFYERFYGSGRKQVPDDVDLTPLTLAVWFMDDGSRSRRAVYLNTQQFDLESQYWLLDELWSRWEIAGSLNRDKQDRRIRITVEGTKRLMELIEPLVLPGFRYKLPQVTP